MIQRNNSSSFVWTLCAQSSDVAFLGEVTILETPFRIGRRTDVELSIPQKMVSGVHASISEVNGKLFLNDLESRNGTFVNGGQLTKPVELRSGDIVQFADAVFRLNRQLVEEKEQPFSETICSAILDEAQLIIEFENLMAHRLVDPNLQSIVDLNTYETTGFEVLVRGKTQEMRSPATLFQAAEKMQRESELSEMIRRMAATQFLDNRDFIEATGKKLFLNTHPNELHDISRLIKSLESAREDHPELELVLEIHESAVTNMDEMSRLCVAVKELGFEVAYDDFGAGQARFFELIEEPPTYLKFDIRLVKDIHLASTRRKNAIAQLVKMVQSLGIISIAEGIEVKEDAGICQELGFDMAQGYYFSRPKPIAAWVTRTEETTHYTPPSPNASV